jgi:hypothetical protein
MSQKSSVIQAMHSVQLVLMSDIGPDQGQFRENGERLHFQLDKL